MRVNSVGTIIEIKPKPTPKPREVVAETKEEKKNEVSSPTDTSELKKETKEPEKPSTSDNQTVTEKTQSITNQNEDKQAEIVADESPIKENTEIENQAKNDSPKQNKEEIKELTNNPVSKEETTVKNDPKLNKKPKTVKSLAASALENIRLVVIFKDGTRIERPMSEVLKFGIDKGVLTVILKDGTIGRYSLLDVEKTVIE